MNVLFLDSWRENEHWVREFYINFNVVGLSNPVIRIRVKEVHFGAEWINKVYRLENMDTRDYEAKDCALKRCLVENLCLGIEVK